MRLPFGITKLGAHSLVVGVVDAEGVTMSQKNGIPGWLEPMVVIGDERRVEPVSQCLANKKIAITMHQPCRSALIAKRRHCVKHRTEVALVCIVSDPDFDEIAQDKQVVRLRREVI